MSNNSTHAMYKGVDYLIIDATEFKDTEWQKIWKGYLFIVVQRYIDGRKATCWMTTRAGIRDAMTPEQWCSYVCELAQLEFDELVNSTEEEKNKITNDSKRSKIFSRQFTKRTRYT